jgi:glycosyltransferase involved in cell wall biosynthesis
MDLAELRKFDAVVCIGNRVTASTFDGHHSRVYACNGHASPEIRYVDKDFDEARNHFLYLASWGQVHRGLDLLLEAFVSMPRVHLHVCGPFRKEKDFVRCYRRELFQTPNVHPVGWVSVSGPDFSDLCGKSAFVILPSCAEGQSGSVIACMHAGLIPIVSEGCGLDTDDFGIPIERCDVETVRRTVADAAARPAEWCRRQSLKALHAAREDYSQEAFSGRLRHILGEVAAG